MAERNSSGAPAYTEAQTKAWLSWLARGMQRHGQTVFMIEHLQPSWLTTRGQLWTYTLSSRLIVGLVFGLVVDRVAICLDISAYRLVVDGMIGGLFVGILDMFRFEHDLLRPVQANEGGQDRLKLSYWSLMTNVMPTGVIGSLGCLFHELFLNLVRDQVFDAVFGPLMFGALFGLFFGIRATYRRLSSDVQPSETLHWSSAHVRKGARIGCYLGLSFALIFGVISNVWIFVAPGDDSGLMFALGTVGSLIFGLSIGVTYLAFAGFRSAIIELKTVPNQGIKLAIRSAIAGGSIATLMLGLIVIPCIATIVVSTYPAIGPPLEQVAAMKALGYLEPANSSNAWYVGLIRGLTVTAFLWPVIFFWYGGLDVLQHYTIRLILYFARRTPLNYARFLDYAAKNLNFLQKVGGGYIFIHRILLEHFATIENEGKLKPQGTSPYAASMLDEIVSDH